jgi:hypothetical protein
MTTLNPALSFNFASAEASRLASAERGAEEQVAAQLRAAAADKAFTVGSTITARYQYKVGQDGNLIPTRTDVTTEVRDETVTDREGRKGRGFLREQPDRRQPSFRDFSPIRAELSPSDEAVIFARGDAGQPNISVAIRPLTTNREAARSNVAEAFDDNGSAVDAESIAPQLGPTVVRDAVALSLADVRAQSQVAAVYARNNDIVYNVTPITRLAA